MEGKIFIEEGKDGLGYIVFDVRQRKDVNGLTLDMIGMGLSLTHLTLPTILRV